MSSIKQAIVFAVAGVLVSCKHGSLSEGAAPPAEPKQQAAQDAEGNSEDVNVDVDVDVEKDEERAAPEDVAREIRRRCDAIQRDQALPLSCQLDTVDDVARLQLVMANRAIDANFRRPAFEKVAEPFCALANAVGAKAAVVVALDSERMMQVADCADGEFSAWQSVDPATRQLTAAAQACQEIQDSHHPIGCTMGEVNDRPSLVVSYASGGVSQADLTFIDQHVADPFCDATKSSGVEAFVYVVEDERRARGWSCVTRSATGWHPIQREQPRPRPGRAAPQDERRQQRAVLEQPRYKLLPVATAGR